jgi:hypothetical protein
MKVERPLEVDAGRGIQVEGIESCARHDNSDNAGEAARGRFNVSRALTLS